MYGFRALAEWNCSTLTRSDVSCPPSHLHFKVSARHQRHRSWLFHLSTCSVGTAETFPTDVVVCCATDGVWNLHPESDSTVVGRPASAAFRSRRFNTRRETRVVESLDAYNQRREECDISVPVKAGTNTFVYVAVVVLSKGCI